MKDKRLIKGFNKVYGVSFPAGGRHWRFIENPVSDTGYIMFSLTPHPGTKESDNWLFCTFVPGIPMWGVIIWKDAYGDILCVQDMTPDDCRTIDIFVDTIAGRIEDLIKWGKIK